ncbi:hypothetical protein MBLNU457_g0835t2 [Dothideomycetes sp. NU457]
MATPASDGSVDFYEDQVKPTAKRRLSSSPSDDISKKRKVGTASSVEIYSSALPATKGLPTEIWQRVFSSLPPDDLCRVTRVNHAFNSYLTEARASMSVEQTDKRVRHCQVVDSESIWDIELLKSNDNRLIKGLPFAFCTDTNDYITSPAEAPRGVAVSKVFSKQQIIRLHEQASQVENDYGRGAADEWIKGLADTAKAQSVDIARWVKWEKELPPEPLLRVSLNPSTSGLTSVVGATPALQNTTARNIQGHSMLHAHPGYPPAPYFFITEQMKREREQEIEQRCLQEIRPPILHDLLVHMTSYNEVINSTTPFTEHMWTNLKPRIEAERDAAEQRKWKQEQDDRFRNYIQYASEQPQTAQVYTTPRANRAEEERFIQFQDQVRPTLGKIADKLIDERWCEYGMNTVNAGNCRTFAADVVVQTRVQFLETYRKQYPYADENKLLSLETMKWVVDTKVLPHVPIKMHKALFRCSECEDLNKWYGFDSMVQHFAAKHTEDFSKGNIVVDWKTASWPADPPFDPEPVYNQKPPGAGNCHPSDTVYSDRLAAADAKEAQPSGTSPKNKIDGHYESVLNYLDAWWEQLHVVPDEFMPLSIKIHTMLHQVRTWFQKTYGSQLSVDLLISTFKHLAREIHQLGDSNGLACSICMSSMADIDVGIFDLPYAERIQQVERFTISGLLDHFKHTHADDEIKDIVELPDEKDIKAVVLEPEVTDPIRTAIGSAFPSIFGPNGAQVTQMELQVRQTQRDILSFRSKNKNRSNAEKKKAQKARRGQDHAAHTSQDMAQDVAGYDSTGYEEEDQSDSPLAYGEDEYDPTRPAFLTPTKLAEHHSSLRGQTQNTGAPVEFGIDDVKAALLRASTSYKEASEQSPLPKQPSARKPKHRQQGERRTSGRHGKRYEVDFYAEEIPDVIRAPSREPEPAAAHYQMPAAQPPQQVAPEHHGAAQPMWHYEPAAPSPYEVRHQPQQMVAYQPEYPAYHQPYQAVEYGPPPSVRAPQEPLRFVDEYGREVFPEGLEPVNAAPMWVPYEGAERAWGEQGGQPRFVYDE